LECPPGTVGGVSPGGLGRFGDRVRVRHGCGGAAGGGAPIASRCTRNRSATARIPATVGWNPTVCRHGNGHANPLVHGSGDHAWWSRLVFATSSSATPVAAATSAVVATS